MKLVPIAIEVRCLRVPTRWVLHKFPRMELGQEHASCVDWKFVPEVDQDDIGRRFAPIEDPWEVRDHFLRMKHTEESTIEFLNRVGVWRAAANSLTPLKKTLMNGAFGLRLFFGRALPLTLESLWRDQEHWKALLEKPSLLHAEFCTPPQDDAPPYEKSDFAMKTKYQNALPVHMEWSKGSKMVPPSAHAVIQPITGLELLIATTQIDLVSGIDFQICQRLDCGIPFSGRRRKYCCENCAHVEAVRASRRKKYAKRR